MSAVLDMKYVFCSMTIFKLRKQQLFINMLCRVLWPNILIGNYYYVIQVMFVFILDTDSLCRFVLSNVLQMDRMLWSVKRLQYNYVSL